MIHPLHLQQILAEVRGPLGPVAQLDRLGPLGLGPNWALGPLVSGPGKPRGAGLDGRLGPGERSCQGLLGGWAHRDTSFKEGTHGSSSRREG